MVVAGARTRFQTTGVNSRIQELFSLEHISHDATLDTLATAVLVTSGAGTGSAEETLAAEIDDVLFDS